MYSQQERKNYLLTHASLRVFDCAYETKNFLPAGDHTRTCYLFVYLKAGCAQLRIGSRYYELQPGCAALLRPNTPAEWSIAQPAELMRWSFQYRIGQTFDVLQLFDFPIPAFIKDPKAFESAFQQHRKLFHLNPDEKPSLLLLREARALEVFAHLLDCLSWSQLSPGSASDIPPAFYEILQQIIAAPENGVQLKALAQQYHMHPTYISNRFKHHFGVTPAQLCRHLVIEKARSLLLSEDVTITEIASRLGFRDVSSFTQVFTEAEGMTPSKYRRSWLAGENAHHAQKTTGS